MVRLGTGLVAAAAIVVGLAAPAAAKGPAGVTITDPAGLSTELPTVADADGGHDERLAMLTEDMGLWQAMDPQVELPQDPPVGPGAAFAVVWTLVGPDGDVEFAQTLYPQARGGPRVHTAPGQVAYGLAVPGGWYRASPRLLDTLASLGWHTKLCRDLTHVCRQDLEATVALGGRDDDSSAARERRADGHDAPWWRASTAAVGTALFAVALAVVVVQRNRRRASIAGS